LKHVLPRDESYNCVIALPPSGLQRHAGRDHCRASRYAGEYFKQDHVL
jgi:hypothetical protein